MAGFRDPHSDDPRVRCSKEGSCSSGTFDPNPLRKIYAELPDYNEQIIGLGKSGLFEEEGRFKDHDFHARQYYDRRVFACTRQARDAFRTVVGK